MPTIQELMSLIDPSQPAPALPLNHPFNNVRSSGVFYWSATTNGTSSAWILPFGGISPVAPGTAGTASKGAAHPFVRCVRGGQGVDPQ